jgi:hypothetical protein
LETAGFFLENASIQMTGYRTNLASFKNERQLDANWACLNPTGVDWHVLPELRQGLGRAIGGPTGVEKDKATADVVLPTRFEHRVP